MTTNGEHITRIVEQDEDFCIVTDYVAETVTIEVSLGWWNKPKAESAETYLGDLAASLENEHAHIVDEKGVEYSAGMIRIIVEVLKAVRTARRVPDGC